MDYKKIQTSTIRISRKFRSYPRYKTSDIEWVKEIPVHWNVKRLKYLVTVNDEVLAETTDPRLEIVYVDIGSVDTIKGITDTEDLIFGDAPSRARRIVRPGDVIISTVRTYLKAIARIEPVQANLIVSTGFAVIRPKKLDDRFVAYVLKAPYCVENIMAHSMGVGYPAINANALISLNIAYPSLLEQRAITAFLDREIAKLDALIEKKERLIELIQEKRTALISQAVTQGLNPRVPMKSSGIEWLGEIPAHWEMKRLKTIAEVRLSNVDKKTIEGQQAVRLCNYVDVYYRETIDNNNDFMSATATSQQVDRFSLRAGDVLITKDSETWTDIAVPAVTTKTLPDVLCGYHLALIRPSKQVDGSFLSRFFAAIGPRDQYQIAANGITRFGLARDAIRDSVIALPPVMEQRAIAAFLNRETTKLDALVSKVRDAIEQLQELRTALISAVVTGQIDIRIGETHGP